MRPEKGRPGLDPGAADDQRPGRHEVDPTIAEPTVNATEDLWALFSDGYCSGYENGFSDGYEKGYRETWAKAFERTAAAFDADVERGPRTPFIADPQRPPLPTHVSDRRPKTPAQIAAEARSSWRRVEHQIERGRRDRAG